MKLKSNIVYKHLEECTKSILVEQGGTRSGKTYNILIWIIVKCFTAWDNKVIDIVRKTFPALRQSALFDFKKILKTNNIYSEKNHNKSENIYTINGNQIRFFSCDNAEKMRGPGRDILYCNEAQELTLEDFRQLDMRTGEFTIMDYNPSEEYHWIYEEVLTMLECQLEITTYKDNPFLPERIIKRIESYKDKDLNYWNIYGLGLRGVSGATIFSNWELTDEKKPQGYNSYGMDFGYNDPAALLDVVIVDGEKPYIWIDELIYESLLTTPQLVKKMRLLSLEEKDQIFGDNSRPETIAEIANEKIVEENYETFNIKPCKKGPGSVKAGLDWLKRYTLKITKRSINVQREIKAYKLKTNKEGKVIDGEPVDLNNHAMDALRYAFTEKISVEKEDIFVIGQSLDGPF